MTEKRYKVNIDHHKTSRNYVTGILDCETNVLLDNHTAINNRLNEQNETINNLQYELMALMDNYKELKTDEKQLSISFIGYKQKVKETLQKHYNLTKKTKDYHIAMILEALANELGVDLND